MELTRRDLLATGGVAMASAALLSAGSPAKEMAIAEEAISWDEEADVVIVGGGGAGSAAAYGAATEGASVIVLDTAPSLISTSTALCGGYITLCDSEEQRAAGIEDSVDTFVEDFVSWGGACDPDVVRRYAELGHDYSLILQEIGVEKVNENVTQSPGSSIPRTLTLNPVDHMEKIAQAAQDAGAVYHFETTGQRLVTEGKKVLGVEDSNGKLYKANNAVILASGGFTSCPELLDWCMEGLSEVRSLACPYHTGLMHYAAFDLGAKFDGIQRIYANEGMHPTAVGMNQYANLYIYGAVKVNAEGSRYMNEGTFIGNAWTRSLLEQPMVDGRYFNYMIMDQTAYDLAEAAGRPLGVFDTNKELFVSADTYEELGEKIGAPKLAETMNTYNSDINSAGVDSVFGRDQLYGDGTGAPFALETPPFYAFANNPWLAYDPVTTFIVNADSQLLDQYDNPIEGVYAVGEIALRPALGNLYIQGAATGAGACFGLQAGRAAAHLNE